MSKHAIICLSIGLLVLLGSATSFAEDIPGVGVSFTPPPSFQHYDRALIKKLWPHMEASRVVMGNKSYSASISYKVQDWSLPPGATSEMVVQHKQVMQDVFTHVHWKKAELVTLAGQPWVYLEMVIPDQKVHTIMLCTGFEGKLLIMAFHASLEDFAKYEDRLRQSVQSIKIRHTQKPSPKDKPQAVNPQ